jgi:DNA-binding PadR family transcriptional regulator
MQFNERKRQALEIFTQHSELRPPEWAVVAGFYPTRASFSYLLRLHRMGLLRRRRDYRDRIVYNLSPHGARWLLRKRQAQ